MYLRNAWYVACWAHELGDALETRTICELPILLYRKTDGEAVAIGDLCPHRFAPLHMGRREGDNVRCMYHGMLFGESGKCVENPHHGGVISPKMCVPKYPVVEKYGLIWVWTGDAEADESQIPDFGCYSASGFKTIHGMMDVQANYQLITDNLLDLTHADFLHDGTLSSEAITTSKLETLEQGSTVYANRWCPDGDPPPVWGQLMESQMGMKPDQRIDHWLYMRWDAPAHLLLDVGISPVGKPREDGAWVYTGHHLTPVSPTRTLYYWTVVRNHGVDDPDVEKFWQMSIEYAFGVQDKPMIEAQQAAIGTCDIDELGPVAIPADLAGGKARRKLMQLIKGEERGERPRPGASPLDELLARSAKSAAPVLPVV
ncbi:Rieske 2Fe-2S domain-containing protein [Altererythrobacter sp.]|uniref:Rieske 2Fe-2S domain-containing protein n=1 Tax=Altererythrobacter sp. TaxID=1872480 RepID=UPI003D0D4521